jgi:hypothetical protein
MPRKPKPEPARGCALHLEDLKRAHGRPPPDVPVASDRPAPPAPRPEAASGCSSAMSWL